MPARVSGQPWSGRRSRKAYSPARRVRLKSSRLPVVQLTMLSTVPGPKIQNAHGAGAVPGFVTIVSEILEAVAVPAVLKPNAATFALVGCSAVVNTIADPGRSICNGTQALPFHWTARSAKLLPPATVKPPPTTRYEPAA